MGYQGNFIAHLPGHILYLTAAIFLALVSFNTPLLKSFYFLKATYSQGANAGNVSFGTLGYCLNQASGGQVCTGPKIGYEIDLNSIFGIDGEGLIKIPAAIGKYLTYVLILHIVALVSCVATIVFRLIDTVDNVSLLCFPALLSWFTSACTFAAFIVDLAMFYIAKARIDSVDGASASIGVSVWFTLVAWVLPVFASCFCGISQVEGRRSPKAPRHDDQAYPQSAGGYARVPGPPLNTYGEREVSVPLNANGNQDLEGKKSGEDDNPYGANNHQLGYSSNDQHYQPRRQPSSSYTHGQDHGTYPPRDPYSTGYYREYGAEQDGDLGAGTAGTYAGVGAGAAAVGGGMAYGNRTGSAQGHGYDGYQQQPQQAQPQGYGAQAGYEQYPAQSGYDQHAASQSYPYQQQHETVEPYGNSAYTQPMPMPVARALSPQNTANRVDPFTNPDYMHDQIPYPNHNPPQQARSPPTAGYSGQDAYGGYEATHTARPMDDYTSGGGYGQSYPPAANVVSPIPRGVNTQLHDGTPQFPLNGMTSPVSPPRNDAQLYEPAPPSYAAAEMTSQGQSQGQAPRRTGSMDKSGGYFR